MEVTIQHKNAKLKMIRKPDGSWELFGKQGRDVYKQLHNIVGEGKIEDDDVAIFVFSETIRTIVKNNGA